MDYYYKFVSHLVDIHPEWDGDLMALSDREKDEAIYIWLNNHESWYLEIYPEAFDLRLCRLATNVLFREKHPSDHFMALIFKEAENSSVEYDAWSEALGDISLYIDSESLIEDCRNNVYDYLEKAMRKQIQECFDLNWAENRVITE